MIKAILLLLLAPVIVVAGSIWRGYVFSFLWAWFMVPIFALPALTIPMAIGVCYVVSYASYQYIKTVKPEEESFTSAMLECVSVAFCYPALALLFGYIVKGWM